MISIALRRYGKRIVTLGAVVFVTWSMFVLTDQFFRIRVLEVYGPSIAVEINDKNFPNSLLFLNEDHLERSIKTAYPTVRDVVVRKQYPDTLKLYLYPRTPIAVCLMGNRYVLVDQEGFMLGDAATVYSYPVLEIGSEYRAYGERFTDERMLYALKFIALTQDYLEVQKVTSEDSENIRIKTKESDILITQKRELEIVLPTLQTLIAGFRIRGKMPAVIDLRFNKPVVQQY